MVNGNADADIAGAPAWKPLISAGASAAAHGIIVTAWNIHPTSAKIEMGIGALAGG